VLPALLTAPGLADIPLIALQAISTYILAETSYRLYTASRSSSDEGLAVLSLGFAFLLASILMSIASYFIGDLFLFSSLVLLSTYASISGYVLVLLCRLARVSVYAAVYPLTPYYLYGEAIAMILAALIASRSRSLPVALGFALLSAAHLLRFLVIVSPNPYSFLLVASAELMRTTGFLTVSLALGMG